MKFKVIIGCLGVAMLPSLAHAEGAYDARPYEKSGVVNCALPGTAIEFGLNGSGGAILTKVSSNYAPFRKAARVKTWSATTIVKDGTKLLVLDNLNKTRIMVKIPEGNGFAFTVPEGVSDILCQILVTPD